MSTKPHIVVQLGQYHNVVIGSVIEQSGIERWCGAIGFYGVFSIESRTRPAIVGMTLFVRGSNGERDDDAFCQAFPTPEKAAEAIFAFAAMIREINGSGCGESETVELVTVV